jgi:hypothetical protein
MSEYRMSQPHDSAPEERREDIRIVVSLPGRYLLPKRRGVKGRRSEYACRMVNISPRAMVLAGPVIGTIGEPVISYFDEFGKLKGGVMRTLYGGFVTTIEATIAQRARLETKLIWLEKHQREDLPNARRHKRVVPQDPRSTLILADGTMVPCFVIDMSASGAAVSAEIKPPIGTPLAVGKVVGKVVRRFAEGFAVHFTEAHDPRFVEQLVIKPFTTPPREPTGFELGDLLVVDADLPELQRSTRL